MQSSADQTNWCHTTKQLLDNSMVPLQNSFQQIKLLGVTQQSDPSHNPIVPLQYSLQKIKLLGVTQQRDPTTWCHTTKRPLAESNGPAPRRSSAEEEARR